MKKFAILALTAVLRRPVPVATLPAAFGILALILAVGAPPARAQTAAVSNLEEAGQEGMRAVDIPHAQGFLTGPNANGYDLTSVQLSFSTGTSQPAPLAVELWSANGTAPGSQIAALNIPDVSTMGIKTFTARTGTTLQADTRYFVYALYDSRPNVPFIHTFEPDGEDSGLMGWSIDNGRYDTSGGGAWTSRGWSLRIAVFATARTQPFQSTVTVAPVARRVTEGAAAQFRLTRTGGTTATLAVNFTVAETGAMLTASPPTSQSIQSGSGSTIVSLATTDDANHENDSTVTLTLTADAGYTVGTRATAQVVVGDNDEVVGDNDEPETPSRRLEVTASCDPCEVSPGGEVTLTATASGADGDPLTYAWSADEGTFAGPTNEKTARWRAPGRAGTVRIRVRVSDGSDAVSDTVSVAVSSTAVPALPVAASWLLAGLLALVGARARARTVRGSNRT